MSSASAGAASAAEGPGRRAASVSSSRSGKRRPSPPTDRPLSVGEFIAQLHVRDLNARFKKEKETLTVTAAAPRDNNIFPVESLKPQESSMFQKYAKTHQMASSFRKARMRTNGKVRDQMRQRGLDVLPFAKSAVEAGQPGLSVRLQNEDGEAEDYYIKPHKEKHKGTSPGLGAALDCVAEAAQEVIEEHAPELKGVYVTKENMKDVLRTIMQPKVGAALMNSIEESVEEYRDALATETETVHLVKKRDDKKKETSGPPKAGQRRPMQYQ